MANEIKQLVGSTVKPTFTGTSLANGAGRICAVVDNTTIRAKFWKIAVTTKSGGSAPTNGAPIRYYIIERSNDGTKDIAMDRLGTSDAVVSTEPTNAKLLGAITVDNTTAKAYDTIFDYEKASPKFSVVQWNAVGQSLSSTSTDHEIQCIPITDEVQ